jgi:glycosyltransferase involved in cell wall biosynthesis
LIDSVPGAREDIRVGFQIADNLDYTSLFAKGDVYIAPEKYNGLSLPLQEAFASGMAVMTTNRFPMNTWLPPEIMIPVSRYEQGVRTQRGHLAFEEAIVDPYAIAETVDAWYGKDISALSTRGLRWSQENSWDVLRPHYIRALESVL